MRRAVKYPIIVLLTGILVSIAVPILIDTIEPYSFGHFVGRTTVVALIVAIVIGLLSDRRKNKKNG